VVRKKYLLRTALFWATMQRVVAILALPEERSS